MGADPRPRRSGASGAPTFRGDRNVGVRESLRAELLPPSEAHVEFQHTLLGGAVAGRRDPLADTALRRALIAGLRDHIRFARRDPIAQRVLPHGVVLPEDMARALLEGLEAVDKGESPALFRPRRRRGGRGNQRTVSQEASVDWAVRYLTAVQLKWVVARGARQEVARRYGVSLRQVERWIEAAGPLACREQALRGWGRERMVASLADAKLGRFLQKGLGSVAKRYRLGDAVAE